MGILYLILFFVVVYLFFKVSATLGNRKSEREKQEALAKYNLPENAQAISFLAKLKVELESLKDDYISHSKLLELQEKYALSVEIVKHLGYSLELPKLTYDSLRAFEHLKEYIQKNNEDFVKNELSRCHTFFVSEFKNPLDVQQQEACVVDEDATLVVAGAGTGKTTTIVGKVKYLISKRNVNPRDIILFSFTRKAAEEMEERLRAMLGAQCPLVTTFHSFGLNVLKHSPMRQEYDIAGDQDLYDAIKETLTKTHEKSVLKVIVEFISQYFNPSTELLFKESRSKKDFFTRALTRDFRTLHSWLTEHPTLQDEAKETKATLSGERVKSLEELRIANFLFLNGIEYEYERPYPFTCTLGDKETSPVAYRKYHPDFYLPQYDIYLEHYALGKDGNPPPFFGEKGCRRYLEAIEWKARVHKQNNTKLICSYSAWNQDDQLIEKLKELLIRNGVKVLEESELTEDYYELIRAKIFDKQHGSVISSFERLLATFIQLVKSEGYHEGWQKTLHYPKGKNGASFNKYDNVRLKKFLEIAYACYKTYQEKLNVSAKIDFTDMITQAAQELITTRFYCNYKYIIVDEFQDISKGRMSFLKSLRALTNAKLFCVGDDWQSIYRFTGSDLDIFVNFEKYFGFTKVLRIEQTYRNTQDLIDVMGRFIMKNKRQLMKTLKSPRSLDIPITIVYYGDSSEREAFIFAKRQIEEYEGNKKTSVFVLGRTNFDKTKLVDSDYRSDNLQISYLTAHKSKGLEADNVIILSMKDDLFGFPNQIVDDPILLSILPPTDDYLYAEERRLFYVAATRARNRVFLLVPESHPSVFIGNLKEVGENIKEVFLDSCDLIQTGLNCPHCQSGHLILRKSTNGARFLGCSHFPLCHFTTKEEALYISQRCPSCGAPMLVRQNKTTGEYFLSCCTFPECRGSVDANFQELQSEIRRNKEKYENKRICGLFREIETGNAQCSRPPLISRTAKTRKVENVLIQNVEEQRQVSSPLSNKITPVANSAVKRAIHSSHTEDLKDESQTFGQQTLLCKAMSGDMIAQYELGNCYYRGEGIIKDWSEARKWYQKSAEQGYASAQYRLGMCNENGHGTIKNMQEAVRWYTRAAEQGHEGAKRKLLMLPLGL